MATNRYRVDFIDLPQRVAPVSANRSDTYRYLLNHALKNKLAPVIANPSGITSGTMLIYPSEMAKIDEIAGQHGLSIPAAFAGLCAAAIASLEMEKKARIKGENAFLKIAATGALKTSNRPDQAKFYQGITLGLLSNKIVLAEASTGVGKGRAIMAAAVDQVRQNKQPIIVAGPTLSVMSQLYDEFMALGVADIKIAIMPGRHEFVDDVKLKEYVRQASLLDEGFVNENVAKWVASGAPNETENVLTKTMRGMGITPDWLMDDLVAVSGDTDFPCDDFRLTSESDPACESETTLKDYKAKLDFEARIIICSHTMLALAAKLTKNNEGRREWSILPTPSVIFIDEAHQFEQAVSQVNSEQLSFFSLRWRLSKFKRDHNLKSGAIVSKALKELFTLTKACRDIESDDSRAITLSAPSAENSESYGKIMSGLSSLKSLLVSKSLDAVPGIKGDRDTLSSISRSAKAYPGTSERVTLAFSPTRNYPSVLSGPSNMRPQMAGIWNRATGGVVLASATLYTPDPDGTMKCDYVRDILAVPLHRVYAPNPVESKYVYSIPVLHYPRKEKRQYLSAPSKQKKFNGSEKSEAVWLKNAAKEIHDGPAVSAKGGTLVLCTAYTQMSSLREAMMELGIPDNRILSQERGKKFEVTKRDFIAAYRLGLRPILLGLGIAWTGLDMADKNFPEDQVKRDMLLTDLAILRAPIGLNRTNSMAYRIEHRGTQPIEKEALLLFKQGLGRLVRRNGVTDRHIWILDGRLWSEWKGMENFTASARQLLAKYKKSVEF